jgi:hypothetical protein
MPSVSTLTYLEQYAPALVLEILALARNTSDAERQP